MDFLPMNPANNAAPETQCSLAVRPEPDKPAETSSAAEVRTLQEEFQAEMEELYAAIATLEKLKQEEEKADYEDLVGLLQSLGLEEVLGAMLGAFPGLRVSVEIADWAKSA